MSNQYFNNCYIVVVVDGTTKAKMQIGPIDHENQAPLHEVATALADAVFNHEKNTYGWGEASKKFGSVNLMDLALLPIVYTFHNAVYNARLNSFNSNPDGDNANDLLNIGWKSAHEFAKPFGKASEMFVSMCETLGVVQFGPHEDGPHED